MEYFLREFEEKSNGAPVWKAVRGISQRYFKPSGSHSLITRKEASPSTVKQKKILKFIVSLKFH